MKDHKHDFKFTAKPPEGIPLMPGNGSVWKACWCGAYQFGKMKRKSKTRGKRK